MTRTVAVAVHQSFTVPGKPVPAVRMTQNSTWGKQAQRYLQFKSDVGWHWKAVYGGTDPFTGPVSLEVNVLLQKPDKRRWDASNVLKAIEDGLNKIAYVDDKQIYHSQITVSQSREGDQLIVNLEGSYE